MHELSIVESIVEIILKELKKHKLTNVESVSLRIGEMRQVVPEAMKFAFECISKGTPLEGAELKIENVSIRGRCQQCHHEFMLTNWLDNCPKCNFSLIDIISGKELEIKEFEAS